MVNTDSKDAVISYIDADDGVTSKVTAMRVDVLATSKDTVTAIGQLPLLKLSFDMAKAVVLTGSAAKVTETSTEGKVTKAYIGKNTKVTALGSDESNDMHSVNVKADSEIVLKTELPVSISLSGRHLGVYFVTAQVGKTDTQAYIGGDVLSYMDINVTANDVIREDSDIEVYNISGFGADFSYSTNKVDSQNVQAYVMDNAHLLAWGDIKVLAHSDLDMESGIKMGSASLFSAGKLEARSEITARNISAEVGDNVTMVSEQGNITVKAYAEDTITTNSTGVSASLADLIGGDPKAFIVYNGDIKTTVGNGTNVKAAYGTVDIVSDLNSDLYASAFRKAASIVSDNESIADILSKVKIHTEINPDGNTQSRILGRITTIGSYISDQLIHAYALSETAAAGSNTTATANINADNDLDIIIGNAWVGGTEILNVESIIVKQKLWAESYAEIVGATGKVFAHSTVDGANHVDIKTTDKAELAGKEINVIADAPDLEKTTIARDGTAIANTIVQKVWTKVKNVVEKVVKKVSKIPFIGWFVKWVTKKIVEWIDVLVEVVLYSDAEVTRKGTYTSSGNVELNGKIHLGGGVAGIFVDVFGDLLDNITVSTSGLDDDLQDQVYTIEDGKVVLNGIYNDDQGTLNVLAGVGNISGKVTTYTNSYIPEAAITNHTDFDLVLKNLTLASPKVPAPVINTSADGNQTFEKDDEPVTTEGTDTFDYSTYGEHIPELHIVSEKSGSIIFDSDKENGGRDYADVAEGSVYIVMNGGRLLTANGAYLAANKLYIGQGTGTDGTVLAGPDQIGNSKDDPFQVYVFDISAYAGIEDVAPAIEARPTDIKAHANGDIFLELTPVKEWMTRSEYDSAPAAGEVRINLNLAEIVGGTDSTVYVNVLAAKKTCANKAEEAGEYVISVPRSAMEFLTADRQGTELTEIQIYTADGQPTDFWLTADGKLLNKNAEITFNADTYLVNENEDYDTYHLPNGTAVVVDKKTGRLAYITTEKDDVYDLSGYQITEVDGNVTITVVSTNADASEWSQKITFKDGKAWMEIGVNGATTYIETSGFSEDGFGWNLPNGIKIYFKQVFIDEETSTVNPGTAIRTETDANGKTVSYIALENLDANKSFWHVVKVTEQSGSYTFQEGYLYSKTALTEKTVVFYQTLDDAKRAVQTVTSSLQSFVERVLGGKLTPEGASTAYVANAVSTAVADSYKGYLTDNLKVSVSTTIYESEGQYSPDGNGGQTLTGYKTLWSIIVTLLAGDGETAVLTNLSEKVYNTVSQKAVGDPETMAAEAAGTKDAASETVISNADGSVYFKKNYAGNWVAYVKPGSGNTVYSFDMNPTADGWYAAAAPSGTGNKRKQAYDDNLKGVFITLDDSDKAMLKPSGEGAIDGDNLNGGYVKLNGAVRFVDSKDHTDKGMFCGFQGSHR